ncbi:MAG: hypothetical protein WDN03_12535 [Rhizomicrobium sp.]
MPDDATVAYAIDSHRAFEELRQVLAQLGGLLVLAAAGGKSAVPDHPMLVAAGELHRRAADRLRALRATPRASHHHAHLMSAAAALESALGAARRHLHRRADGVDIGAILAPLRLAQNEMERVTRLLPGFDLVDFDQGCCAEHCGQAGIRNQAGEDTWRSTRSGSWNMRGCPTTR